MNLVKRRMNKKGSAFDVIYIMIILLMIALVTLVAVKVYNEWAVKSTEKLTSHTSSIALQKADQTLSALDGIFAFVIVMLFILVFISAFTINTHPAFFIITLIILIVAIILAVVFSNIYEQVSTEDLPEEGARFVIMVYLMGKLPFIALIAIVVVAVILYAKFKFS